MFELLFLGVIRPLLSLPLLIFPTTICDDTCHRANVFQLNNAVLPQSNLAESDTGTVAFILSRRGCKSIQESLHFFAESKVDIMILQYIRSQSTIRGTLPSEHWFIPFSPLGFRCCSSCGRVLDDNVYSSDPTFSKGAGGAVRISFTLNQIGDQLGV